ncbi:MAG: type 4a pilus biogenesis protein PilO [Deltaproteobacteria bacterium]|nr:type 4a pilus biogenesis protein PilO [Deltaproteobacteria bacterium]
MNLANLMERLARLQRPQRLAAYLGAVVLIALIYLLVFFLPKNDEISTLDEQQAEYKRKLAEVEVHVANRNAMREKLNELNESLSKAKRELPNNSEIPNLLKAISTTAKKSGLEVRRFQPLPEVKKEYVAEVPVALEVTGSYHEVAMFFDQLSRMSRIVYVQDVAMSDPDERGDKVYLTVTGKAVTFRFLSDEEKAAEAAKAKGKKKGGGGGGGDE